MMFIITINAKALARRNMSWLEERWCVLCAAYRIGGREGMQVVPYALAFLPTEIKSFPTTDSTFEYVSNSI